jgi:hypothetical protein
MCHLEHPVSRETVQASGRRKYRRTANGLCCTCRVNPRRVNGRDCKECHAAYQKKWNAARSKEINELRALKEQLSKGTHEQAHENTR